MPSWNLKPTAELDEAITWFRRRTPIGAEAFDALRMNAKRQGFWMAQVHTAGRAKRIQDSLQDALAHGMTVDTWRKNNKGILRGIPRGHLETTFRNWTQTSYNAARVDYLSHPAVVKRRPYWVFDAVIDGVTTAVCRAFNGIVLVAKHPWFKKHTPPLHHNCRSSIRGLTANQASKLGIRQRAPASVLTKSKAEGTDLKPGPVANAPGFGVHLLTPWQPTTRDYPKGIRPPKRPKVLPTLTKKAPTGLAGIVSKKGGILGARGYNTDPQSYKGFGNVQKAFEGATKAEAQAIATGKLAVKTSTKLDKQALLPPVRVEIFKDAKGRETVSLIDGRHRAHAAHEAGATHIRAEVVREISGRTSTESVIILPLGKPKYTIAQIERAKKQ
jgi:SPP1 gp7 family putative phage head morphogenesis protein